MGTPLGAPSSPSLLRRWLLWRVRRLGAAKLFLVLLFRTADATVLSIVRSRLLQQLLRAAGQLLHFPANVLLRHAQLLCGPDLRSAHLLCAFSGLSKLLRLLRSMRDYQ